MAKSRGDRNVLVGLLALQLGFITREQLLAAMTDWVTGKQRSMEQVLVELNVISDDTGRLLSAVTARHLDLHDDDIEKSLASLSAIGSIKDDLRKLDDSEVDATLTLLGSGSGASSLPATRLGEFATHSGEKRFRVIRPHAAGGLGKISIARDAELNREVALKELQDKYCDDENIRSRFVSEAEITGLLEHPGVVPVYGLGQYDDGRPFYAMRFIAGDSLRDAIRRFHSSYADQPYRGTKLVELRQLLGRFVDVCNAIAFAHSRGILHRDLKPGNIMLGQYGETLVVDWGLAKQLDAPSD